MTASILFITTGFLLTLGLGLFHLHLTLGQTALALFASIMAGLGSLFFYDLLATDLILGRRFIRGAGLVWLMFTAVYFGILFLICPFLLEEERIIYLALPLIFVTGISILIFGPIQDWLVARYQTKSK